MPLLQAQTLDNLRSIPIKDLAERLGIELGRGRSNAKCFNTAAHKHGDKNGSLGFNERSNRFKCFACEVQGDTIALVQAITGKEFREACEHLADLYGIQATVERFNAKPDKTPDYDRKTPYTAPTEPTRINEYYDYDLQPYSAIYQTLYDLSDEPNQQLVNWYKQRRLSDKLLQASGWRTVTPATANKLLDKYNLDELNAAGLIRDNYDIRRVFKTHTVITPYFNGDADKVIYVRFRTLEPGNKTKYLAPKDGQPIIYRFSELYKYAMHYEAGKPLYITESETDALAINELASRQNKRAFAIALVGGQKNQHSLVVRELIQFLDGLDKQATINIVTDRDATGDKFYNALASTLYKAGFNPDKLLKWQEWPERYKDPGDYLQATINKPNNRPPITDATINNSKE